MPLPLSYRSGENHTLQDHIASMAHHFSSGALCRGDTSSGPQSSPQSNLSDLSQVNESINQSVYDVHVYVSNKDNEHLKVSIFIDFDLKDTNVESRMFLSVL